MDFAPAERELLVAAEQNARRALTKANKVAEQIIRDAYEDAVALLLQQQAAAASLLLQEAVEAERVHADAEAEASDMTEANGAVFMKQRSWDADQLLEAQQRAADMLLQAQREAAAKLAEGVERAAADALLAGQREAAAFLLEARMRVEAERAAKSRTR